MANTITVAGSFTLNLSTTRVVGSMSDSLTLTGSNASFKAQNVDSASWEALDTSSLSDLRYAYFANLDTTSSITIATGSSGQNMLARLNAGDVTLIAWSGSLPPLYAKAELNPVVLQYILTEK